MKNWLRPALIGLVWVCVTATPGYATNGYQLIGVGQMQKSMGGAVTALPMDTMTAISNPAGMSRVGERADFSLEAFMPVRTVDFRAFGGEETEGGTELYGVPSVGWVAKAFGRDDMYFGGGMFATSGLGVDYGEVLIAPAAAFGFAPGTDVTFDGQSAIQFWKMAPTVSWRASDRLSVGVAVNMDYQSVTIRQRLRNIPFGAGAGPFTATDVNLDLGRPTSQLGLGGSIGVLFDMSDVVTLGVSYTTRQYFSDANFRVRAGDVVAFNGATGLGGKYKMHLDYPQQAAVGIAVRPGDDFVMDLDVKWINWNDTHDNVLLRGPAGSFASGAADSTMLNFDWDNQWVVAFGMQWQTTEKLAMRTGVNWARAPIQPEDVMSNLIFPALVERHIAFGVDYTLGDHWGVGGTIMRAVKASERGVGDVPAGFVAGTPFTADSNFGITLYETSVGMLTYYRF